MLKVILAVVTLPLYFLATMTTKDPVTSLSWVAAGVIFGIVSASVSAWVLLVEIQRDRPRGRDA